jgi:sulfur carrier protein
MRVTVNGEAREVAEGTTVAGLIRGAGLAEQACAAEVNRALVPRREHEGRELREGDVVELVTLVGGG